LRQVVTDSARRNVATVARDDAGIESRRTERDERAWQMQGRTHQPDPRGQRRLHAAQLLGVFPGRVRLTFDANVLRRYAELLDELPEHRAFADCKVAAAGEYERRRGCLAPELHADDCAANAVRLQSGEISRIRRFAFESRGEHDDRIRCWRRAGISGRDARFDQPHQRVRAKRAHRDEQQAFEDDQRCVCAAVHPAPAACKQ